MKQSKHNNKIVFLQSETTKEFNYTPEVLNNMSIQDLSQAWNNLIFVRELTAKQAKK